MPVTIRPSSRTPESWGKREQLYDKFGHATSAEIFLANVASNEGTQSPSAYGYSGGGGGGGGFGAAATGGKARRGIVQSSFGDLDRNSTTFATKNGLVHGCLEAYNEHHNLVLRPDDVWLAILTQLSVYVNANAEDLRGQLVPHAGRKALHIEMELANLDHGAMAFHMTKLMSQNLKDPSLRDWILPAFSTTEKTDQTVASIVFMGTMQKYFAYSWGTRCGIPSVTLLGDADDWVEIAQRCAARLGTGAFGPAAERWYRVLKPVLAGFLETFRNPAGAAARSFWKGIVDKHRPNGSGTVSYSGWITAFCYWDEKGQCLHDQFAGSDVRLSRSEVPMGFSKVPVTLIDNGKEIPTEMLAGSVGVRVRRSEGSRESTPEGPGRGTVSQQRWNGFDTIQPESGWFMYFV